MLVDTVRRQRALILQFNGSARERAIFARLHATEGGLGVMRAMKPARTPQTMTQIRDSYLAARGIKASEQSYHRVDESRARRLADHFERAPHAPHDPAVKASYAALKRETLAQYDHLQRHGLRFERWNQPGEPYANSEAMARDVHEHHHLYFFPTVGEEHGVGGFGHGDNLGDNLDHHPMLEAAPRTLDGKPLLYNDVFRAVHDAFGHSVHGWQFGPRGEENAWISHARMYSPAAHMALAGETRAQNSWVNFGPHLRRPDGSLPKKGEEGYVAPAERPFAEQKAIKLPAEFFTPPVEPASVTQSTDAQNKDAREDESAWFMTRWPRPGAPGRRR